MSTRLKSGGRLIDRSHKIGFTFNGKRLQGYEGDPCPVCGHLTLVRNGTCLKCLTCGSTTGCS